MKYNFIFLSLLYLHAHVRARAHTHTHTHTHTGDYNIFSYKVEHFAYPNPLLTDNKERNDG